MCRILKTTKALSLLGLVLLSVSSAHAATLNYDFIGQTAVESDAGTGLNQRGNIFQFSAGGVTLEASTWGDTNGVGELDHAATIMQTSWGLGSCNEQEGDVNSSGCLKSSQLTKSPVLDNAGGYDWLLIVFPQNVSFETFSITPSGNQDKDVTYWAGSLADSSDVSGLTYDELDALLGARVNQDFSKSTSTETVSVIGADGFPVFGNAILIGAQLNNGGDRFAISGLSVTTTPIPLPAGFWLMISALGVLFTTLSRKSPAST